MWLSVHKPWYVVTEYLIGLFVFGGFESLVTFSYKPAFEGNRHAILNSPMILSWILSGIGSSVNRPRAGV